MLAVKSFAWILRDRLRLCVAIALIGHSCIVSSSIGAQIYDHHTSTLGIGARGTRLWLPDGGDVIRDILIYGNGAGGDSRGEVLTPWNQALAILHGRC